MNEIVENKLRIYAENINKTLKELSILVSFSGGIDSIVLSSILIDIKKRVGFNLALIHFNHNAHYKAQQMEEFCENFARLNYIKYYRTIFTFDNDLNFESTARFKRYQTLYSEAHRLDCDIILTAHHRDDQIETLYMKKIDRADWISKIGIRECMGKIMRPMLDISKVMIIDYAKINNLTWIDDPSNNDNSIRRNYIRNLQLPAIMKESPNLAEELLSESVSCSKKMGSVLSSFSNKEKIFIQESSDLYIKISLEELIKLSLEERKLFLYWSIKNNFKIDISSHSRHFWLEFYKYLCNSDTGSKYFIDDITCFVNRSIMSLIITPINFRNRPAKIPLLFNKKWYNSIFKIKDINCIKLSKSKVNFVIPEDMFNNGLHLRQWNKGDKILLSTTKKHSLISDLFINNKFSRLDKFIHPIVVDSLDKIVWIPGIAHGDININNGLSKLKNIEWVQA